MSIQSEITRITNNVQDTIDVIEQTGVSVPAGANSDNLPSLAQALANEKQDKLTGTEGQVVGFDAEGNAVAQDAASGGVGKSLAGQTVSPTNGSNVTAGTGSEIFNDYRERSYSGSNPSQGNVASGDYSHAEGMRTTALGYVSHAEGNTTLASGMVSHAEGQNTTASGQYSHAEGQRTMAAALAAHAEGYYTIVRSQYQHAQGKFNIEDAENKYAHIVGNGTNGNTRSNAHTLDWDGNAWFAGDVYAGGTGQIDGKKLAQIPICQNITLTASAWASNTQTVTVQGVSATETDQLIQPVPAIASQSAYYAAGILCTGQAANSLTFTCTETPTENLTVYVVIQEVSA